MSAIEVKYRRFPGYGDIVSPICYTHNISEYFNVPANLTFFYRVKGREEPFEHPESEPVEFRSEYIFNNTDKTQLKKPVNLFHVHKPERTAKHNMLEMIPYHNYAVSDKSIRWHGGEDYVTFITAENNALPFHKYENNVKDWKDPLSAEEWNILKNNFENIKYIDYTTPIEEAVEILKHTKLVISYHGSAAWLARWLACPQVIFSKKLKLTSSSFPNAVVKDSFDKRLLEDEYVQHCRNVSIERTKNCMRERMRFMTKSGGF